MSLLYIDGFDHVSAIRDKWPIVGHATNPTFIAGRNGGQALAHQPTTVKHNYLCTDFQPSTTVFVGCAIKMPAFNAAPTELMMIGNSPIVAAEQRERELARGNAAKATHAKCILNSNGSITLEVGTLTVTSATGVVVANTWHYIELKLFEFTSGTFECRVDEVVVATITGNTNNPSSVSDHLYITPVTVETSNTIYYDDMYIANSLGTINNSYLGDVRVDTHYPTSVPDVYAGGGTPLYEGMGWQFSVDQARVDVWQALDNVPNLGYDTPEVFVTPDDTGRLASAIVVYATFGHGPLTHVPSTILGIQTAALVRTAIPGVYGAGLTLHTGQSWYPGAATILDVQAQNLETLKGDMTEVFTTLTGVVELNPETGLSWTIAELDTDNTGVCAVPSTGSPANL
jgi:hypothetical protein